MMKYDKYISTTLPYANSTPHIGHALEFIQADALARYFRNCWPRQKVFFNIGVDENGLKVYTKAKELGLDTKVYLDGLALEWIQFTKDFEIGADNFYRTTRSVHHDCVREFWTQCEKRGDLYKKSYTGRYCTGCESFKTDADLVDGKCPDHGTEPVMTDETNWFFRVTNYRDMLITWLDANPHFLSPKHKTEELRNIILSSDDISVSRLKKNVPWGINVPGDDEQVVYVWFDALLNYIFAVEDFDSQHFIQICGPDNLRFQGSLFQAMLESAGRMHTKKLLVHGTVVDANGVKMSKSLGNVVDPAIQLEKYGLDAVRYYTLAGLTTYGDCCWSEEDLVATYNSQLADDFGNLIARTLHLIDSKQVKRSYSTEGFGMELVMRTNKVKALWDEYEIYQALRETNTMVKFGNQYINHHKPWSMGADCEEILGNLLCLLEEVTNLYVPVLSTKKISDIRDALYQRKKVILFEKLTCK